MNILTVKNPWAGLIIDGIKDIENRTWKTNYRGKLYIHSSSKIDMNTNYNSTYINSAILGYVELIDCIRDSKSKWAIDNYWHWIIVNAVKFEKPILNIKGKLGIWTIPKRVSISIF